MQDLTNETMLHVKRDKIEYIQFKKLLPYEDVLFHCYTLKPLDFNPDFKGNLLLKNSYKGLMRSAGLENKKIVRILQTHSDRIQTIREIKLKNDLDQHDYKDIDGVITTQKDIYLSLRYADCIPLYFWDPVKEVIANIHSGWKGTLQRIGEKAVKEMIDKINCQSSNIICCIGPSIGKCHFEVDEDVKQKFESVFENQLKYRIIEKGNIKDGKQKYYIDTVLINRLMLREIGLKDSNIIQSNICTVCHHEQFHSYRAEKEKAGRNTAIIGMKKE